MSRRSAWRGIAVLLAVVTAVPVGAVAAASAPLSAVSGRTAEPWPGAVRGPHPSWPDRHRGDLMPPALPAPVAPPAAERGLRGTPRGWETPFTTTPLGSEPLTSATRGSAPLTSAARGSGPLTSATRGSASVGAGAGSGKSGEGASGGRRAGRCAGGPGTYQREVERGLRLRVDGVQSARDCRAIRAFQRKHGVKPADGTAGRATWARVRALSAREAPHRRAPRGCPARSYRVACVDLTHQRTWVQQRGRILYGPVPMRSGSVRHPTRTGWFTIYWRHRHHRSTLYNSPMPYAQFFSGGQAFHAVRGSIRTVGGSMGCVNLRPADARGLWKVLRKGDRVYVWGRRPRHFSR
ncbi:L,D-transpeptidase family protein [Streptomyces sp. NPDC059445]|uniref:L,D-transpeptidase family protein n=1 Tax=Streptomyces sp. NPDC059445 TaxID=3346832 RepID=UPI00368F3A55